MVNPSSLTAATAAAAFEAGTALVRRTAPGPASATVRKSSTPSRLAADVAASVGRALGTVRGRGAQAVPGWAVASGTPSRSPATSSRSALSFLSDPKLSIEEKLMRLLAHLNGKWEKEMEAKMKQLAGEDGTASSTSASRSSSSASSKKKGGLLATIASAVSGTAGGGAVGAFLDALKIPGVKTVLGKIGGPVLAAAASALGFPAAAPLLLKYGPVLVDAAAKGASAASPSSGGAGTSGTKALGDGDRQKITLEIQRLQEKQKEMFGLVSNVVRSNHETRMVAINNIR
jgi:hypothetical protein